MRIAVFGQDPGGTTGLAWGIFDLDLPNIAEVMKQRTDSDQVQVTGDEHDQIRRIANHWHKFFRTAVMRNGLHYSRCYYVSEDFVLRGGDMAAGKDGTSPERICWGVEGYRMGMADLWNQQHRGQSKKLIIPKPVFQQAGMAKGYATKERLKDWDCWIVGKEHSRSAWQHIGLFVKGYLDAFQANNARSVRN